MKCCAPVWLCLAVVFAACDPVPDPADHSRLPPPPPPPPDLEPEDGSDGDDEPEPEPPVDSDWDGVNDLDDCAPDDSLRSAWVGPLYADADYDGYTSGEAESLCVASYETLDAWREQPSELGDCDDTRADVGLPVAAYADTDFDGIGAGERSFVCPHELGAGLVELDGDCAPSDAWANAWVDYASRDADGDGWMVSETGRLCTGGGLPDGYGSRELSSEDEDCDDANALLHRLTLLYADQDGDGFGAGEPTDVCAGDEPVAGFARQGGDCAPEDAARDRTLQYSYRDADGDGRAVWSPGAVCSSLTLPNGYFATAQGTEDCDDADPARFVAVLSYADEDGDGAGAGSSERACTDGNIPRGRVTTATDCAPTDPSLFETINAAFVDRDGDGQTVPEARALCTNGTLPAPHFVTGTGNDCDDEDPLLTRWLGLFPDRDGDGVGAYPYEVFCLGEEIPEGYARRGDDDNDDDPGVTREDDRLALWGVLRLDVSDR